MDEEKLDRRMHWAYAVIAAIVALTTWMVKIQMTQNQQAIDIQNHVNVRDMQMGKVWDKIGTDHDRITKLEQWKDDHSHN